MASPNGGIVGGCKVQEKAIDLAHKVGELNIEGHVVAHIVYRFGRTATEPSIIGGRPDVKWDLDKAVVMFLLEELLSPIDPPRIPRW